MRITLEDFKIIKYVIACYLGLLAVELFKFSPTATISITAAIVVSNDSNIKSGRDYSIKRLITQCYAIIITIVVFYFIKAVSLIPEYQVLPITSAISVYITLALNKKFSFGLLQVATLCPVIIVMVMITINPNYHFLRVIYTVIGVIIGHTINCFVFPVNHGKSYISILNNTNYNLNLIINNYDKSLILTDLQTETLSLVENDAIKSVSHLMLLKDDMNTNKKYSVYSDNIEQFFYLRELNEHIIISLKQVSEINMRFEINVDFKEYYFNSLLLLFECHNELALNIEKYKYSLNCNNLNKFYVYNTIDNLEVIILSKLIKYYLLIKSYSDNI